jgi:hypothetical protein
MRCAGAGVSDDIDYVKGPERAMSIGYLVRSFSTLFALERRPSAFKIIEHNVGSAAEYQC